MGQDLLGLRAVEWRGGPLWRIFLIINLSGVKGPSTCPMDPFFNSALGFPLKTPQGERHEGPYSTKGSSIPLVIEETLKQRLEKRCDKKVADDVDERRCLIASLCSSGMGMGGFFYFYSFL